ncbi:hypothetical protein PR003_g17765 [Phytophthora rubi]|uniref:Uncharacterized protein n=1 Tax=Phytophthora rubi TaxID=129364 RepID=A0A6A4EBZ2_9STRA|nr:hypothetical protein PR003_g17765 [Phytophthora rubi]
MAKPAIADPAEAAHVSDSAVAGPASSASSASGAAGSAPSSDPPATEDAAESSPRATDRSQVGSAPARPLMAPIPCNPSVWAPVMGVAFSSRFPDEPLFESPLELEEFFRAHSPSPPPSPDAAAEPDASSNPDSQRPGFQLRSILKDRSAGDSFPLVGPPQEPTRDDPAMRPVSPASPSDPDQSGSACPSPAYSKTNSSLSSCTPSPPHTPVPPGFRPDGLMEAGIPRQPTADAPGPSPSSPVSSVGRLAPSDSPPSLVGSPCSTAEDESTPATVAELWGLLQRQERARRDHEKNQARLTAYALLRPPTSSDAGFRRDLLSAESSSRMLEILQADAPEPPCSTKELAELRVRDAQLTRENNALTRRMETAVAEASRLSHELAVVVRERDEWKKEAQRHTELITSFRKIVCTHEATSGNVSATRCAQFSTSCTAPCTKRRSVSVGRLGRTWRAWWLRQPALHPYNECFLPLHPEFPVFSSADFDHAQVRSLVAEDVDPSAPTPPLCSAQAPTPANREELSIFESTLEASDDASA